MQILCENWYPGVFGHEESIGCSSDELIIIIIIKVLMTCLYSLISVSIFNLIVVIIFSWLWVCLLTVVGGSVDGLNSLY